jgi:hypothetical protein
MSRKVNLSVNDVPINLDQFVHKYIDHVIGGIVASLKDTGEIESLDLTIDNEGRVAINLNDTNVPLSYFPMKIIRSTILGMISPLKGVDTEINRLEITVRS